jgi:hypothetical protein
MTLEHSTYTIIKYQPIIKNDEFSISAVKEQGGFWALCKRKRGKKYRKRNKNSYHILG